MPVIIYPPPDDDLLALANSEPDDDLRRDLFSAWCEADLRHRMSSCTACPLRGKATQVVCWSGPTGGARGETVAACGFGEGPGGDEDAQGEPFVGESGRIIEKWLFKAHKIPRESFPFVNAVGCRPWEWTRSSYSKELRKKDRAPKEKELEACDEWVREQLSLINPWLIVCFGATAARRLWSGVSIRRDHGKLFRVERGKPAEGTWAIATYHPGSVMAYRDKGGENLKAFKEDLQFVAAIIKAREKFGAEVVNAQVSWEEQLMREEMKRVREEAVVELTGELL